MKKILNNLNYISLFLLIIGIGIVYSYGTSMIGGVILLILGIIGLTTYFLLNIKKLKDKNSRMNFIFASNLFVVVFLIFLIIVAINYLGIKVHKRFDLTKNKTYSISDQSIKVVKNLKKDIIIKGFFTNMQPSKFKYETLMDIYRYYSDKVKSETIDPDKNPSAVKTYKITTDGTVVFEYGKKETRITEISEEAITNAIIKVTREKENIIYFLQGHGEPVLDKNIEVSFSIAKENLEKLSYKVKPLFLMQEKEIPTDASVLVIAGLDKDLFDKELKMIEDYIFKDQGRVLFMIDPYKGENLKPLLKRLGIKLNNDVIVDTISRISGGDFFIPVVNKYGIHQITENFNYATFFPLCRSLDKVKPQPKDTVVSFLASTSPYSWAEMNYEKELKTEKITKNPEDKAGPLNIMAAVELKGKENKKARIVITGDSDFITNKYYYFSANGNLFNNIISWLADQGELVSIAPKTFTPSSLVLTQGASKFLFFYTIIILPLIIFIIGIAIWLYRRKL